MDAPLSAEQAAVAIGVDAVRLRRWIKFGLVEISSPGGLGYREHRLTPDEVEQLRVVAGLVAYGFTTTALIGYAPRIRRSMLEALQAVVLLE